MRVIMGTFKDGQGKKKTRTRYSIQQSSSMGDVLVIDKVEADRRTRGLSRLVTVVSGGAAGQ
jgi:hypothetical protein